MRKYTILAMVLALCAALLVGCGCMNTNANPTTVPTTIAPTTAPTTAATQAPTTMPTTEAATQPTDMNGGTSETAGEDGIVDTDPTSATGDTGSAKTRSNHRIPPLG